MNVPDLAERTAQIQDSFQQQYGQAPSFVVRAPGRVNLIGEHTDYNEGFVFPAAIDREMLIAARALSPEADVRIHSLDYGESDSFSLDSIEKSAKTWSNYLRGVLDIIMKMGRNIAPFEAVLTGNVPQGAGLSSSAAFEVAVATLMNFQNRLGLNGKEIALLAQKAENQFIGVNCGIMDQFISALAEDDSALLIDCRSLEYRAVKLNLEKQSVAIVITNSGVRRGLVDSEYNTRRRQCEEGVQLLAASLQRKLNSLRDVSLSELHQYEKTLPEVVAARCRHVISENERVLSAVKALEEGDLGLFGRFMNDSHTSLRDDYHVSIPQLDVLVELTVKHAGVLGARMTGAGFGGCTVALMKNTAIDEFIDRVLPQYEKQFNNKAEVYVCKAVGGAAATRPVRLPAIS
jgi:galactokinase